MQEVLKFLPTDAVKLINTYDFKELEEIRIRANREIILKFESREVIVKYKPRQEELVRILQFICDNSIYSFQNQICNRIYNNKGRT